MERCDNQSKMCLGGGFKHFDFHPYLGKWSQLTNIFQMDSNGLKPPTLGSEMTTRNLFFWKLDLQGEVRSIGEMCSKRLYVWPLFRGRFPFFGKKSTSFQEDGRSYCKLVVDSGDFFYGFDHGTSPFFTTIWGICVVFHHPTSKIWDLGKTFHFESDFCKSVESPELEVLFPGWNSVCRRYC